jgi:hypothetical protein
MNYTQRSQFYLDELKSMKQMRAEGVALGRPKDFKNGEEDYAAFVVKDGDRKVIADHIKSETSELRQIHSLILNQEGIKEKIKVIKERKMTRAQKIVRYMT